MSYDYLSELQNMTMQTSKTNILSLKSDHIFMSNPPAWLLFIVDFLLGLFIVYFRCMQTTCVTFGYVYLTEVYSSTTYFNP
jgi:hypothetical protein